MCTLNIQLFCRRSVDFPELAIFASRPGAIGIGSNYPWLEHFSMVPKVFEPLKFDCISFNYYYTFLNVRWLLVGVGNLGVILVRVCEPVFQNLPHSYTWPSKKQTHSYTWSSKMLTYSYTALWFFVPIFCWLLHKYHSQFIYYQGDKQPRKISERKICAYTRMSEKWGLSDRNPEKSAIHILFVEKRGPIIYLAVLKKGAIRHAHPYYAIYRKLPPPPHTHTPWGWLVQLQGGLYLCLNNFQVGNTVKIVSVHFRKWCFLKEQFYFH